MPGGRNILMDRNGVEAEVIKITLSPPQIPLFIYLFIWKLNIMNIMMKIPLALGKRCLFLTSGKSHKWN